MMGMGGDEKWAVGIRGIAMPLSCHAAPMSQRFLARCGRIGSVG